MEQQTILVVDDDKEIVRAIAKLLEHGRLQGVKGI